MDGYKQYLGLQCTSFLYQNSADEGEGEEEFFNISQSMNKKLHTLLLSLDFSIHSYMDDTQNDNQ